MAQPFGLRLYLLARAQLAAGPAMAPAFPRPQGPLIWLNAPSLAAARACGELIRRIMAERDDVGFLVTLPPDITPAAAALPPTAAVQSLPPDRTPAAQGFLDHWRPDLAVFSEGTLPAALVDCCHARGVPLFLIDALSQSGTRRWLQSLFGVTRALLQHFDRILAQDEAAARRLRRQGAPAWRLDVAGKMEETTGAMPCTEAERDAMAGFLRSRPVWVAVAVPEVEESSVIAALRIALRLSHRLLLILVPEDPARGPALADYVSKELGLNVSVRSRDEDPDSEDQVYVADTEGEFGLWYRLAPLCYMGGTLFGGNRPRHPFEAAALGSAILFGTMTGLHADAYHRLADAGAARLIRNALELGDAVSDLMSPDKAAQMAHDAWAVSTSGAEVTDSVMRLLLDALDSVEQHGLRSMPPKPLAGRAPA